MARCLINLRNENFTLYLSKEKGTAIPVRGRGANRDVRRRGSRIF
jgi:hypothetical protein